MIWFSPKTDNKMLKLGKMGPMDLLCHLAGCHFFVWDRYLFNDHFGSVGTLPCPFLSPTQDVAATKAAGSVARPEGHPPKGGFLCPFPTS